MSADIISSEKQAILGQLSIDVAHNELFRVMESLIRANIFFFCSPIAHTVSHDIHYSFLCKQCVELAQFCQGMKWFCSIVEVECAIIVFWIIEN